MKIKFNEKVCLPHKGPQVNEKLSSAARNYNTIKFIARAITEVEIYHKNGPRHLERS